MTRTHNLRCLKFSARNAKVVACFGVFVILLVHSAFAQTYTVLHTFTGVPDGAGPVALMLDSAGNLYGATSGGGANPINGLCSPGGCGTIFRINSAGKEHVLYRFAPNGAFNGYLPFGPLLAMDAQGNIYGTTLYGGNFGCNVFGGGEGCGTVFKLDPTGHETVLYRFTEGNNGGTLPAGVALDAAGNLYGTTQGGGGYQQGTVFRVDSKRNETVLHVFQGPPDGGAPIEGVVLDPEGNLYGTTFFGGVSATGTIFEVSNTGVETILHDFGAPGSIGGEIEGSLLRDSAGNLYGTAVQGGDPTCSCGIVYKLDPSGNYTVLYSFTGGTDGANPQTGLALDALGNLYGTTRFGGGAKACGTVFKLSPSGTLTPLHAFTDCSQGGPVSVSTPVVDADGNVYGSTAGGGYMNSSACAPYGCGVIFKITP